MKIVFIYSDRGPQMVEVSNDIEVVEVRLDTYNTPVITVTKTVGLDTQLADIPLRAATKGWVAI